MCYLVLCDQSFSKRLAFSFLEDLQTEFGSTYGSRVETVSRPYSFIEFGKHLSEGYIWTSGLQGFTLSEDSDLSDWAFTQSDQSLCCGPNGLLRA